jgi:hypothetical protein
MDIGREQQLCLDQAALEDWLRGRGGQPWFEGVVLECIERFPRLDRFQVTEVILKLRDEACVQNAAEASGDSIRRYGVDFDAMSDQELRQILREHKDRVREGT